MPDCTTLVVITPDELQTLVREAVRTELAAMHAAPSVTDDQQSFNFSGAVKFTQLSESSLRRAIRDGRLRPIATGCRAIRFSRDSLLRFVQSTK